MRVARPWIAAIALGAAALTALTTPSAAAASTSSPTPQIAKPGGLEPGQQAVAAAPSEHIVKDVSTAPSCTGYRSQTTPPKTIRVFLHTSNTIMTVNFETYVEDVLPNEWVPSWDGESLKAGAVAVKSYAWFWVNHYGGYFGTAPTSANCFDVDDTTNWQVYDPTHNQTRTNNAVQQSWPTIARNKATHEILQAMYRADLVGSPDTCGQGANGSTMSQDGSQDCAHRLNKTYDQILHTYYDPNLELATASLGPVSAPPPGQVFLSTVGTLAAYRMAGGTIFATQQNSPGGSFNPWSRLNAGPTFVGQPVALKAVNGAVGVYARAANRIEGDGQATVGASFSGWHVMGASSPSIASDPAVVLQANGGLAIYATDTSGFLWGITQAQAGAPFSAWTQLTTTGGFTGKPAVLVTAAGPLVIYARNGANILGAGQSTVGGTFGAFSVIGTSSMSGVGDPTAFQGGDGTVSVLVAGEQGVGSSAVWMTGQPAPGTRFGDWRQVSTATSFSSSALAYPSGSSAPIGVYAADTGGLVRGAQAATPGSQLSSFAPIGTGNPGAAGNVSIVLAANRAVGLYVIGAGNTLWGSGQSVPGAMFSSWSHIGS